MKIVSEKNNSLLHRKEILVLEDFESNPGFVKAKEFVAEHYKVNQDCIVILAVRGGFGTSSFSIEARVYDSSENKIAIEPKPRVKKEATA
jgi:ribosomal protein S24E